ncbi:hypothetical protein COBT_002973 [Conglomerata obtusa]
MTCSSYTNSKRWIESIKIRAGKQYKNLITLETADEETAHTIAMNYLDSNKAIVQDAFRVIDNDLNKFDTAQQIKMKMAFCNVLYNYYNEVRKRCKEDFYSLDDTQVNSTLLIAEKIFAYKHLFNIADFEKIVIFDIIGFILLHYNAVNGYDVQFNKSINAFAWLRAYQTRKTSQKLATKSEKPVVNPEDQIVGSLVENSENVQ